VSHSKRVEGPAPIASPLAASTAPSNLKAIVAMVCATAIFTCGDASMKLVAGTLPTGQTIFARGLVSLVVLLHVAAWTGQLAQLRRAFVPAVGLRCLGDMGGAVFFQSALARMKLADIMGIIQLTPLSLTAASALFLGERVGWRRWTAVAVGFCGALLIIKPGSSAFNIAAIIAIISVLSGSLRDISTRRIDKSISPVIILLISQVAITFAGLAFSPFENWTVPTQFNVFNLVLASFCSMIGQLCLIYSVRSGEISAVAPFRYSGMLWAILLGLVIWGDLPDKLTFLGILVLISAGLYTLYRERVVGKQRRAGEEGGG
jgi:drug/metabolite transporter (DMT)-like permease